MDPESHARDRRAARLELWRCSIHHFLNDGYSWALYPLLPLIAADFHLGYGASGAIKSALNLLLSGLGLPFGILAERIGELTVLTMGTLAYGVGLAFVAGAWSYSSLLGLVVAAGAGGAASHPVGSALVSRRYTPDRMGSALGILNFSGDIGKAALPLTAGFLASFLGWRPALLILGLTGAAIALGAHRIPTATDSPSLPARGTKSEPGCGAADPKPVPISNPRDRWGITSWPAFISLHLVGILDSLPRSGVVVFIPFILADRGISTGAAGGYLAFLAAGGATGKLFCGPLGDVMGKRLAVIVTEILTSASIMGALYSQGYMTPVAFFILGFFLNGTSSVLYSLVPGVVSQAGRSRGFGLYYTVTLFASGFSPLVYGLLADRIALYPMMHVMAGVVLLAVPLSFALDRHAVRPAAVS